MTAVPSLIRLVRPAMAGQHDLGRRDREIGAVMFAEADEINADVVGQRGLVQHLAQDDVHGLRLAIGAKGDVAESVEAKGNLGHGKLLCRAG